MINEAIRIFLEERSYETLGIVADAVEEAGYMYWGQELRLDIEKEEHDYWWAKTFRRGTYIPSYWKHANWYIEMGCYLNWEKCIKAREERIVSGEWLI